MAFPKTPALSTDCAIFDGKGRVLLIRRGNPPFKGEHALPGGFVEIGETVEDACRREVLEEVGIEVGELRLIGVYSDPDRDPRGHAVSVAFLAVLPNDPGLLASTGGRVNLLKKRNRLLESLRAEESVSDLEVRLALAERMPDRLLSVPRDAPHLLDTLAALPNAAPPFRSFLAVDLQRTVSRAVERMMLLAKRREMTRAWAS